MSAQRRRRTPEAGEMSFLAFAPGENPLLSFARFLGMLLGVVLGLWLFVLCIAAAADWWYGASRTVFIDPSNALLAIIGVAAAVVAFQQLREHVRTQRAKALADLYSQMFRDPDIRDAYYLVDRDEFVYDRRWPDPTMERKIDRLIGFADLACRLKQGGVLGSGEMEAMDYELSRLWASRDVQSYLADLVSLAPGAFQAFRDYGERKFPSTARSKWRPRSLGRNIALMSLPLREILGSQRADELIRELRDGLPGPLQTRLRCLETGVEGHPVQGFYGTLLGHAAVALPDPIQLIDHVAPFFAWDYGTEALREGCEALGWESTASLLAAHEHGSPELVEALWVLGLARMAGCDDAAGRLLSSLRRATERGQGRSFASLTADCYAAIDQAVEGRLGIAHAPTAWDIHRQRLWYSAAVMALYHHNRRDRTWVERNPREEPRATVDPERWLACFRELLEHAAAGRQWPVPGGDLDALSPHAQRFMEHVEPVSGGRTVNGPVEIGFLEDLLEILNLGNSFGSCLRLGGEATIGIVGWATNPNIRVIAATEDALAPAGPIIARCTLAMCISGESFFVQSPIAPPDTPEPIKRAIDEFAQAFAKEHHLDLVKADTPVGDDSADGWEYTKWDLFQPDKLPIRPYLSDLVQEEE